MQFAPRNQPGHISKEIEGFDQKVAISETGTVLEAGAASPASMAWKNAWPASC